MLPASIVALCETAKLYSLREQRAALETTTGGSRWRRQTQALLNKFGFVRLGSGAGGVAYGHPTYPYIIKAFRQDAGFRAWLEFVRAHQTNPWVPRLRGKNIRIGQTEFVRMERLKPIPHDPGSGANRTAFDLRYVFELMIAHPHDYSANIERIGGRRAGILHNRVAEIESDDDLYTLLQFFQSKPAAWLDLHMGNWMVRADGQLVIIDPLYARKPLRSLGQSS